MIPLLVLPFILLVVLVSSIGGDRLLWNRFAVCADHRPIRIGDEQERLVITLPVTTKSRGPSWGRSNYPKSGLVNPPRRDTRALSPAGVFGGKAPPRLAA